MLASGEVYVVKITGPWGTPYKLVEGFDDSPSIVTDEVRLDK